MPDKPKHLRSTLPMKLLVSKLLNHSPLTISYIDLAQELNVTDRAVHYIIQKLKGLKVIKVERAVHAPNTYTFIDTEENRSLLSRIIKDLEATKHNQYPQIF